MKRLAAPVTLPIALLVPLLLIGCTMNPATGRRQLLLMSTEQEIALGTEAMPGLVEEYGGEVESGVLRDYISLIGHDLAAQVEDEYRNLPWEFTVVDSDVINAFALPGGKVFISRGLLLHCTNEAQVAAVLGHEVGHVTSQHTDERISQAMVVAGIAMGADAATGDDDGGWAAVVPLVVGVGGQGYLLRFGRTQESESDAQGLKYMVAARYDPRGMLDLLQILIDASEGARQPEFFSTHPDPVRRQRDAARLIEDEYQFAVNNQSYRTRRGRFNNLARPYLSGTSNTARANPRGEVVAHRRFGGVTPGGKARSTAEGNPGG